MLFLIHTPGEAVSPQIYLDSFFAQCQKGKAIEEIAAELISSYAQNKDFELSDVKGFVTDFEKSAGVFTGNSLSIRNLTAKSCSIHHTEI